MTDQDAIRRLQRMKHTLRGVYHADDREALKRGIEALQARAIKEKGD